MTPVNTPSFNETMKLHKLECLRATAVSTLQVNMGKFCNQACRHCHVDAGPKRTELMTRETVSQVLAVVRRFQIPAVDITGGAPELNPNFDRLVRECRLAGTRVMVRHNLTVQLEAGKEGLAEFFRDQQVEVVASLPYFLARETDAQRGQGVFRKSLQALKRLNEVGYGRPDSGLELNLVYNPAGAFLPPKQESIERDFKRELDTRYGVVFNRLFTITNMPIHRFLEYLHRSGNYERYMGKLVSSFNPATLCGLMCRTMISVGWDGRLYDCDFNQTLDLPLTGGHPKTVAGFDPARLASRIIATGDHCYGCTAGAGSSCGGATA